MPTGLRRTLHQCGDREELAPSRGHAVGSANGDLARATTPAPGTTTTSWRTTTASGIGCAIGTTRTRTTTAGRPVAARIGRGSARIVTESESGTGTGTEIAGKGSENATEDATISGNEIRVENASDDAIKIRFKLS